MLTLHNKIVIVLHSIDGANILLVSLVYMFFSAVNFNVLTSLLCQ